jgi:hypothetical protein
MPDTPDLEAIRYALDSASPGPWTNHGLSTLASAHRSSTGEALIVGPDGTAARFRHPADADFCAAARSDIPALLAYIDHLERRTQALQDIVDMDANLFTDGHDAALAAQQIAERALR